MIVKVPQKLIVRLSAFLYIKEEILMNEKLGKIGSAVTGASVVAFALDMIIRLATESDIVFVSYLASFFIAVGYVMLTASFISVQKNRQLTAVGLTG